MKVHKAACLAVVLTVASGLLVGVTGSSTAQVPPAACAPVAAERTDPRTDDRSSEVLPDEVSDLGPGTPSVSRRDIEAAKERAEGAGAEPGPQVTGFRTRGYQPVDLPRARLPYSADWRVSASGDGLVDESGVRVFTFAGGDGRVWEHPVAQAQYSIRNIVSYEALGSQVFLDRAVANAQRLVDRRLEWADGWYFPYDFDFAVHGDTTQTLLAPWYSGMAQGQALTAFVRLYELTCDEVWKEAADRAFATLSAAPVAGEPFASWVDATGLLWLEEYPRPEISNSERVLNGHIFAAWGVYDYWRITRSERARELYDGALTTVEATILAGFRRPQQLSVYSLHHAVPTRSYHRVHIAQLLQLSELSREPRFVQAANLLRMDQPTPAISGAGVLTRKVRRLFRVVEADGRVLRVRRVNLRRALPIAVDRRMRVASGVLMVRIASARHRGWWVAEAAGVAWAAGAGDRHSYGGSGLSAVFQPGRTYTGYAYDRRGRRISRVRVPMRRVSRAPTQLSGIVEGRPAFYFAVGAFKGTWVPMAGLPFR